VSFHKASDLTRAKDTPQNLRYHAGVDDVTAFSSDVLIFLGAGASKEAGIPLMSAIVGDFVNTCRTATGKL